MYMRRMGPEELESKLTDEYLPSCHIDELIVIVANLEEVSRNCWRSLNDGTVPEAEHDEMEKHFTTFNDTVTNVQVLLHRRNQALAYPRKLDFPLIANSNFDWDTNLEWETDENSDTDTESPSPIVAKPTSSSSQPQPRSGSNTTSSSLVLGMDTDTQQPVKLEGENKDLGLYIIGQPGMGKSTLMLNMILQDIEQGNGVCVLDPHGDLVNDILARWAFDPSKLVLLDPDNVGYVFGLNLFQCNDTDDPTARSRTAAYVMGIFEKLWGDGGLHPSWGAQLEDILRHICQTFVHAQKYTLVDVPMFLEDQSFRNSVIADLNPMIQDYWERSYNPRKDQANYRASTLNKVRKFTDNEILYPILGQSKSTVNFAEAMEERQVILASLPEGRIGDEAVTLLGSLIIGQILQATLQRVNIPQSQRVPFSLYCDEYYYFATSDFPRFFAEGRKFRVSTVIAHQSRHQLDSMSKQATLNVANKIAFRVSGRDAQELSHEFVYTPPQPTRLVRRKPFDTLLRTPHANKSVYQMVEIIRATIDTVFGESKYTELIFEGLGERLVDTLNSLLYILMTEQISFNSPDTAKRLWVITAILAPIYMGNLHQDTISAIRKSIGKDPIYPPNPKMQQRFGGWFRNHDESAVSYLHDRLWRLCVALTVDQDVEAVESILRDLRRSGETQHLRIDVEKANNLVCWLYRFCEILTESPLYETTVLDAPGVDPREANIVALLSNISQYQARARIQVSGDIYEGNITTLKPLGTAKDPDKLKTSVGDNYARLIPMVFAEIRVRQGRVPPPGLGRNFTEKRAPEEPPEEE